MYDHPLISSPSYPNLSSILVSNLLKIDTTAPGLIIARELMMSKEKAIISWIGNGSSYESRPDS